MLNEFSNHQAIFVPGRTTPHMWQFMRKSISECVRRKMTRQRASGRFEEEKQRLNYRVCEIKGKPKTGITFQPKRQTNLIVAGAGIFQFVTDIFCRLWKTKYLFTVILKKTQTCTESDVYFLLVQQTLDSQAIACWLLDVIPLQIYLLSAFDIRTPPLQ